MSWLAKLAGRALSPPTLRRETALVAGERLSALTHLVSSLEYLCTDADRREGGLNNWQVARDGFADVSPRLRAVLDFVAEPRTTKAVHVARVAAALALLAPLPRGGRLAANAVLSLSSLALYPRHHYGTDGSDQVSFLVQTAATVARAGQRRPDVVDACLWYMALQSTMSYAVSGWVKLGSRTWRSGRALPGVMRTLSYGDRDAWRLIDRYPRTARVVGASVLALECAFPAAFLFGGRLAKPVVASAAAFHLANARLMGLGRFLTAFGALHPAVLYATGPKVRGHGTLVQRRDDAFPVACLVLLLGAGAVAITAKRRTHAVVARGRADERTVTVASGNRLAYRLTGPATADPLGPVVVLEAGIGATAEHWAWLEQRLATRFAVLTYQRAGYGRSEYRAGGGYRVEHSVADLVDLVKQVAGDRPVVLAGHSFGGHLALRAAARLPGHVDAVCLLEPGHPGQSGHSREQQQQVQGLDAMFTQVPASLRMGLGVLLTPPRWATQLPDHVRALAIAQHRDASTWQAARREWRAGRAEPVQPDQVPALSVPVQLLAAGRTGEASRQQHELRDALAATAPATEWHVLAGSSEQLLADQRVAAEAAELITEFVQGVACGQEAGHGTHTG